MTGFLCSEYLRGMRYGALKPGSAARLGAGLLIALTCSTALPQHPVLKTRPKDDRDEHYGVTHRITMNVQVTDASGNPVSDLRAEEFTLYDNQQPRRIAAFHPIDGQALTDATEVVILLDAVNTPSPALDAERNAIFRYLAETKEPLSVPTAFALWFNGHLSATAATTDRNAIGRAFVKLTKNIHSNACGVGEPEAPQTVSTNRDKSTVTPTACRAVHFKDSVAALDGIAQQQLASGGRTLLVWMGSGWPTVLTSELDRLSTEQRTAYSHEFVELLHDLRAAQITMYSIAPGRDDSQNEESASKKLADRHSSNPTLPGISLSEFAERTGGRSITASADIVADLHSCIRDAEWYYSIAFNAPPAQNGSGEMHSLAIKVDRPALQVRTMNSYYTEPQ